LRIRRADSSMIGLVDDHSAARREREAALRREARLVEALRRGDEASFERLVALHHSALLRAARTYVRSHAAAEEVVQDTWAGALRNLPRFAGRSSLRTWLYRIMANQAVDPVRRERRSVPYCALGSASDDGEDRADVLAGLLADGQARRGRRRAPRRDPRCA